MEAEGAEPVAEVAGEGGGSRQGLAADGVREAQFGGVKHLARDFGEIGAASVEVLAIA